MHIIEDTRQQAKKHELKHEAWRKAGIEVIRSALPYGDYITAPMIAVDTKASVQEIAGNLCGSAKERARFVRECKKAASVGAQLIVLIEDKRIRSAADLYGKTVYLMSGQVINGEQLARAMAVVSERYGVRFDFCKPNESAKRILEILEDG